MQTVSFNLPSELYVALYSRFENSTNEEIVRCLWLLLDRESANFGAGAFGVVESTQLVIKEKNTTEQIWEISERIYLESGGGVLRNDHRSLVIAACLDKGIKETTASTMYSQWKKSKLSMG